MRNEVENPVRKDGQAHEQSGSFGSFCAPHGFIDHSSNAAPDDRRDQTMRIRVVIRVEHAACRETFDDAQLLNPEKDECRPDIIEELDSSEQNPKRDSVFIALNRKRDTVMPDKHFSISSIQRP